jgi:hypothetical protein
VVAVELTVRRRHDHEADVEMKVFRFTGAGRDEVHVEIDRRFDHPKPDDAGLLARLAERNLGKIWFTVGVPTGL